MKASFFKISKSVNQSIKVEYDIMPHFYDVIHYHPEIQLTLIIESTGSAYIGDQITNFNPGDIFLVGGNLPHIFKNDAEYFQANKTVSAKAISIYFRYEFLDLIITLPEALELKDFVEAGKYGIYYPNAPESLQSFFYSIHESVGFTRVLKLLQMLNTIASGNEYQTLSKSMELHKHTGKDPRIEKIFDFIINHFTEPISLEVMAEHNNMTPTSFSRYFKKITRKTFSGYLNEVRISNACHLMVYKGRTVTGACFESGFRNISNFNRQFKRITNSTPREIKEKSNFK